MKKVLIIASVPSMIGLFNMDNINVLLDLGYCVDVACNWNDRSVWSEEKVFCLQKKLVDKNINCLQIDFSRSIFNLKLEKRAYNQIKKICFAEKYTFVHVHTPIPSALVRLALRRTQVKVVYTAHGFHFYKGAPLFNWLIYYPIEKILSSYTDILITINKEDYNLAKKKFKMKHLEYVPGVGVDEKKYTLKDFNRKDYRKQLGLKEDDFFILSIGELNKNKNHEIVIKAIAELNNKKLKYLIAGQGGLKQHLEDFGDDINVSDQLYLLGYRDDIPELLNSCDLYVLPSIREGLNVSLMEALSSPALCAASNIRGNVDLMDNNHELLFSPLDINDCKRVLIKAYNLKENENKPCLIVDFSSESINKTMRKIFDSI